MRQPRCLEFMKDYDVKIHYHPGKVYVVAEALSRKTTSSLASILIPRKINGLLANIIVEPTLVEEIRARQYEDKLLKNKYEKQRSMPDPDFTRSNGCHTPTPGMTSRGPQGLRPRRM
ncbi:hypothetical protein HYC85_029153 [Camellia sinensis]|uniref:Reverse transcriptase domain-containing protein n=1 Tax=Camellia sinensis TaxID=4442 RepID=A0A7J7FX98_CAMSI|nr:hypothetical protein HYC85_029153 [Camellia sinensis]